MLDSEKSLNDLKSKEAELKTQLDKLGKERGKIQEQYVRDKVQVAVTLSDKLFRLLYQGDVAQMFDSLAVMTKEINDTDPKSESRLHADGYGLKGGDAQTFYANFVFPNIINGRGLADILEKTKKHGDNPYIKTAVVVEPRAPTKEGKKNV
jgi:hypothetical protein